MSPDLHLNPDGSDLMIASSVTQNATRLIDWLFAASLGLALIAYGYLGSYSRYMADDYSAARTVRTHGLLEAQIFSYKGWTGRFSFTFVSDLVALIGPATPRFIPGLLLALWVAATVWAVYELHSLSGRATWSRVVICAGFVIFATLETAPNIGQSLYWQTGALTYIAPFIPLSLYVGVITRAARTNQKGFVYKVKLAGAGLLTFVAGGFSDAYVVLQSCALLLCLLTLEKVAGSDFKTKMRPFLLAGLAGSLLAFIIVALAPGNTIRLTYFPKHPGWWEFLRLTARYSLGFAAKVVITHPLIVLAALTLPFVTALRNCEARRWHAPLTTSILLLTPPAIFLLMMCCIAPGVYAMSTMLPERARILLSLTFVSGTLVWSRAAGEYVAGFLTSQKFRETVKTIALLLLILLIQISFFSILRLRHAARSYAADWDRQDLQLKAAKQTGVTDVTVQQIGDFQSRIGKGPSDLHLRTDSTFWINQTTATYYGLTSVRASEDVALHAGSVAHRIPDVP